MESDTDEDVDIDIEDINEPKVEAKPVMIEKIHLKSYLKKFPNL